MPSFDVISEVDRQELKNAVDQAQRELANRFDFKNTDSSIEQKELILTIRTSSEDRLRALKVLLEEKFVKRQISLRGLEWGKIEQASGESVRQIVTVIVGITSEKAKEINKLIKEKAPKGIASQTQGEQLRVTGKKRDDLQATMALLKGADLGIAIQFENFRD
jgi:cyclic-di-GMP-binding protein